MDYSFIPSLEYTALIKTAVTLWNQDDIRRLMANFVYQSLNGWEIQIKWTIEEKVIEKAMQLSLPGLLKKKLTDLVKPIGLEILNWRQYHEKFLPKKFVESSLDKLCWTQRGTVDRKRTAEVLVRNQNTYITIRYKLACMYCLEHDIPDLWDKIPQYLKKTYYSEKSPVTIEQEVLIVIWTYDINGKLSKLIQWIQSITGFRYDPYEYACHTAVLSGNRAAAEYFLCKLTPAARQDSMLHFAEHMVIKHWRTIHNHIPKEYYSDILWFLLSQMTLEQQIELFTKHSYEVLASFLDWPLQYLFMRLADFVWSFLSKELYYHLLCTVVSKVIECCKDFDYQKLFAELWHKGSSIYKKYAINRSTSTCELLSHLFRVEDRNNILLILKDANSQEKEDIIFCDHGKNICKTLVYRNKWDLLELFVQECIPLDSTRNKFKREFKSHVRHQDMLREEKVMWNAFFKNFDKRYGIKRNISEGNNRRSKRLCNKRLGQ